MNNHELKDVSLYPPFPQNLSQIIFGMGCFWGAERHFWQQAGIYVTAVGYVGGQTNNPDYSQVCTGLTGHAEVVLVVFDAKIISLKQLLKLFWESHDPTQGNRQGNDMGSQYRSVIYCQQDFHFEAVMASKLAYASKLHEAGLNAITTEIALKPECFGVDFNYAEDYHQQYLHKNPAGYCGLRGTGIAAGS